MGKEVSDFVSRGLGAAAVAYISSVNHAAERLLTAFIDSRPKEF
jgi:hypothetical protein